MSGDDVFTSQAVPSIHALVVGDRQVSRFSHHAEGDSRFRCRNGDGAVRRLDLQAQGEASLLHWIPKELTLLPNTAGCYSADEAVRTLR